MAAILSLEDPIFTAYAFCAAILALKMLLMALITAYFRINKGAFPNPEDAAVFKKEVKTDVDVERIRRAHQNDLENIPVFWVIGFLYSLSNPCATTARIAFGIFVGARILHTIFYLRQMNCRPHAFAVGMIVNVFMIINVLCHFCPCS